MEKKEKSSEQQDNEKNNEEQKQQQEQAYLQRSYTFWFTSKKQQQDFKNYEDTIREIGTFDTVDDFWAYYQHMQRPDSIPESSQFFLFKENIKPMWEHESNKNGGRYLIRVKKKYSSRIWEDLLLSFIGEQCEEQDDICGLNLITKENHIQIYCWIKDIQKNKIKDQNIRQWIMTTLGLTNSSLIEYKDHPRQDKNPSQQQGGSSSSNQQQGGFRRNKIQQKTDPKEITRSNK